LRSEGSNLRSRSMERRSSMGSNFCTYCEM
jgi:hypothetical protein